MRKDSWQTRLGSRVWLQEGPGGEMIHCEGCPRPIRVTGGGLASAAAQRHARTCRK